MDGRIGFGLYQSCGERGSVDMCLCFGCGGVGVGGIGGEWMGGVDQIQNQFLRAQSTHIKSVISVSIKDSSLS